MSNNPLLRAGDLDYGLPDFRRISSADFLPALEDVKRRQLAVLHELSEATESVTFDNTVLPLEGLQRAVARVTMPFYTLTQSDLTPELEHIQESFNVRVAELENELTLHPGLYRRLQRLDGTEGLSPEQAHIVTRRLRQMQLAGAGLHDRDAERVKHLNERLSALGTAFDRKLLADTQALALHLTQVDELAGLGADEIAQARDAASVRGLGGYLISLTYPTGHPYLSRLHNRDVRRRLMEASLARCHRGNENDTREIIEEIAQLRAERARLLGFGSHAAWVTAAGTAKTPAAVLDVIAPIARRAGDKARCEQRALEEAASLDGITDFSSWDWPYYAEKVRQADYGFDAEALREYFELDAVVHNGVFAAAERLYGLTFHRRHDLPGWNDDTRVYEVCDDSGEGVGLFLLDPYARETKKGGAWMHELVVQNHYFGERPVVCNNLNILKPPSGESALLTLDEVDTLFHEFGHALHALLSNVTYPSVSGTNVETDFVEFPSQVNEMWVLWPELVTQYARHVRTGEPLPASTLERIDAARTFNQGFATSELLSAALIDFEWHLRGPDDVPPPLETVEECEREVRQRYGLDNACVPSRYSAPYFQHIFSGGYSASYYGYIWAEVLDAETVLWFTANGGLLRENGQRFADAVLSVGGSVDALAAFETFLGHAPRPDEFLWRRGLPTEEAQDS